MVHPDLGKCPRDRHLFGPGPKRILALDGGGVRGAITVAFLERIEQILDKRAGHEVRLGDYFDLVGGTSTGAIIAGALALGHRVSQVRQFYEERAHLAFKRQKWHLPYLKPKFDGRGLRAEIERVIGDCTLGDEQRLVTGLCIVTKRLDTGSPWILTNSPRAPYWETPVPDPATGKPHYIGNKHYRLSNLVRASTAAPHFFDPELLPITEGKDPLPHFVAAPFDQPLLARMLQAGLEYLGQRARPFKQLDGYGLFIDGGVSPYGNPSIALLLVASLTAFGLNWRLTPNDLALVSIGTGTFRPHISYNSLRFFGFPKLAFHALMSVMSDAEALTLTQMQWLGECASPWTINSEIKKLVGDGPTRGKLFRFFRYDIRLELDWIKQKLGVQLSTRDLDRFRAMDDPGVVEPLHALAHAAAEYQVKPEDWTNVFPPSIEHTNESS
jgi:hypothetical protein